MTDNTIQRIGFACKLSEYHPTKGAVSIPSCNFKTTTAAWLRRQSATVAHDKLQELVTHNLAALHTAVSTVGSWDSRLRFFRIGSDVLPLYTHPEIARFYHDSSVIRTIENSLRSSGELARQLDVRLSFHPGQYTCLASDRPEVVDNSIAEVEYHTDLARWMGYGGSWHDHGFKINIHLSGRLGELGFRQSWNRLSLEARNLLTVENDEMSSGLDTVLQLSDIVPVVLDLHHHYVHTGEYIEVTDSRVSRAVDSWRGVRPVIHYSLSRESWLNNHATDVRPDRDVLVASGINRQKLRAHSDRYWNTACNSWALEFLSVADIMAEAKDKNLAAQQLFEQWVK